MQVPLVFACQIDIKKGNTDILPIAADICVQTALMIIISIVGILLLNFAKNPMIVYPAVILFGCALAATFVLVPLITIYAFGPKDFANIYGFVTFFIFIGPAVAPPLSGMIYDMKGSYQLAFMIYAVLLTVVLITALIIFKKGGFKEETEGKK